MTNEEYINSLSYSPPTEDDLEDYKKLSYEQDIKEYSSKLTIQELEISVKELCYLKAKQASLLVDLVKAHCRLIDKVRELENKQ